MRKSRERKQQEEDYIKNSYAYVNRPWFPCTTSPQLSQAKPSRFIFSSHRFHFSLLLFYYWRNRIDLHTNRPISFERKWLNKYVLKVEEAFKCLFFFYETVNSWVINTGPITSIGHNTHRAQYLLYYWSCYGLYYLILHSTITRRIKKKTTMDLLL